MKKSLIALSLGAVLLTSTGCMGASADETGRLTNLLVDTVCMTSDAMASVMDMSNMDFTKMTPEDIQKKQDEITKKGEEMEKTVKGLPAKHGFADEKAVDAAFNKVSDKAGFRTKVSDAAKAKCNPKAEVLDGMLNEIK